VSTHALRVLDRAVRTAAQALAGYLLVGGTIGGVEWNTAVSAVILSVAVSLLQGLVDLPPMPYGWFGDALGRALRTFGQTALAGVGTAVLISDVPVVAVAAAALLAAVTSIITSLAATPLGPSEVRGTPEIVGGRVPRVTV
jgi:Putative lactococcus lactis phage r1t holin